MMIATDGTLGHTKARVAVPEAVMHEHGRPFARPREVRRSGQGQMPPPAMNAGMPQQRRHAEFGRGVPAAPNAGLQLRAREAAELCRNQFAAVILHAINERPRQCSRRYSMGQAVTRSH